MPRDLFDLLGDLPDWPGSTPPKNRSTSPKRPKGEEELNGAKGKVYRISGEDVEMFTVGELARALGRKPGTIRMWESRGWIPRAKFRTPAPQGPQLPNAPTKGRRLYSRSQVEFLVEAVAKFKLDDKVQNEWEKFKVHIKNFWPK